MHATTLVSQPLSTAVAAASGGGDEGASRRVSGHWEHGVAVRTYVHRVHRWVGNRDWGASLNARVVNTPGQDGVPLHTRFCACSRGMSFRVYSTARSHDTHREHDTSCLATRKYSHFSYR